MKNPSTDIYDIADSRAVNEFLQMIGLWSYYLHSNDKAAPDKIHSLLEEKIDDWRLLMLHTSSPIEQIIGTYLIFGTSKTLGNYLYSAAQYEEEMSNGIYFFNQYEIGKYRADFMIVCHSRGKSSRIAVECDGHDFHEKTKEQAQKDKSRDRFFASENVTVLRFTGSEIWRKSEECFDEISDIVEKKSKEIVGNNG